MKTPLLIVSDAPSASSGLGRICRDLATRLTLHCSDIYDVATLGYGGIGDYHLPFFQYPIESMQDWFIPSLREVWENFSQGRKGIVLFIWDTSRVLWFARPDNAPWCPNREIREWLMTKPFEKWIYAPMDADGPNGMLTKINGECLMGFDRILAYSEWAKKTIENTLSPEDCEKRDLTAIPHGIDTDLFTPKNPRSVRSVFRNDLQFNGPVLEEYDKIVGIVATNQTRKDYGLACAALADVMKDTPIRLFIQIDILERNWSIPALLYDYMLLHRSIVNTNVVSDEILVKAYAACDLTLGIGPEGFGYPIFESLACGTPVLAGSVGGHAEHMESSALIQPEISRVEGVYNCVRPVYDPKKWAYSIRKMLRSGKENSGPFLPPSSLLPQRLDWKNLWSAEWEPWFRRGHTRFQEKVEAPVQTSSILQMDSPQAENDTSIVASAEGTESYR